MNILHWDGWIKVLQFLTSFSILVLIHEFGHFLFAKLFKVKVEKFYLFFNPWFSLFKFKLGETIYGIGWVPFGGYCKIAGMVDETTDADELESEPQPWEYRSRPAWQRLFIIIGGVLMNIVLAIAIYIGITYKWGDEYIRTADVKGGFEYSEVWQEMGFRNGDAILTLDGKEVENFAEIPKIMLFDDVKEVLVERDGQQVVIPINESKKFKRKMLKQQRFLQLRLPFVIAGLVEDGNAAKAGLMAGDSLVALNGQEIKWFDEYRTAFGQHKGDTVSISLIRKGEELTLPVYISEEATIGVYPNGVLSDYYPISKKQYTFLEAVPVGFTRAFTSIADFFKQLKLIASPETEAYKSVGGVIAMGKIFPTQWNWQLFWQFTALLSIMLAMFNILPIPMLDGGHVVFILYEMITRRKPSDKFMERAQLVGMIIVFGAILLANGNDIFKLIFN